MMLKSQPARNGIPQAQSVLIIAIALFAFSGLMVGFAVGAFARPNKSSTANNPQTQPIIGHTTPTPTPDPTPTATVFIALGCPYFPNPTPTKNADGTLAYSASIQAKSKTPGQCHADQAQSVAANGLICRIWLVPRLNDEQDELKNPGTNFLDSAKEQLLNTDQLSQPFPQEVQNGLVFDPTTPNEVQPCPQGKVQWKFTISPQVPKGNYDIIGLTDWQGKSYNWSWWTLPVGKNQQ